MLLAEGITRVTDFFEDVLSVEWRAIRSLIFVLTLQRANFLLL